MPAPDDPRIANLFLLLFGGSMGWLFSLGLARSRARTTRRRDLLFLLSWGYLWVIVLLVNAAVTASVGSRWAGVARKPPLVDLAAVEAADNGAEVMLVGHAQPAEQAAAGPACLIEYDLDGRRWGESGDLRVGVAGGTQRVTGLGTASTWNWRYDRGTRVRYSLAAADPVVVLGVIRHGRSLAGERGARTVWVEAALVRRGNHAEFVLAAAAQGGRLWPRLLTWASLLAAIVVGALPLVHWVRARR